MCMRWAPVGMDFLNESIYSTIIDIAPDLDDTIDRCLWKYNVISCSEFSAVFSEDGLCFTFNALNSHEIFTEA